MEIVKIVVDGVGGIGKTTMLKKLKYGEFDPIIKLTIGLDFFIKEYNLFNHKIVAQFWDLVGASRFDFLRSTAYKGANCVILACDLTRPMTLERINHFVNVAKIQAHLRSDQIILVGTKTDLFYDRNINPEYLTSFFKRHSFAEFIETSARNGHNIDVLFELATGLAMFNKGTISSQEYKSFKEELGTRIQPTKKENYEILIRKCWNCDRTLYFYDFCDSNKTIQKERLLKLWESPYLQFYCCSCFKKFSKK